jgi:capsular exopolysaccharide synthesis family protein
MQHSPGRYIALGRRWAWLILSGILICASVTFIATLFIAPTYVASSTVIINLKSSASPYENLNASELAVPTYAQLLTSPQVLNPVVAQHPGMTLQELIAMMAVKPQTNTELIELDVSNHNPQVATELTNQITQSFLQFTSTQFSDNVQVLPAVEPTQPASPKPLTDTAMGALVGLGLSVALVIVFEWAEDRVVSIDEIHTSLKMDILTVLPQLSRSQKTKKTSEIPALQESYRILSARINLMQHANPFKLLMITSSVASEGKSTTTANLATFLAKSGKKVLLVEADLRLPTQSQHFQLEKRLGFSSALMEPWSQLEMKLQGQATAIAGLHVLAAEVPLRNSSDLLQAPQVKYIFDYFQRIPYDYVIFDTPPLLPVADTQLLASYIQTAVLVVDASKASRKGLARAKEILQKTHTKTLGVVINKSPWANQTYGYGYGYGYGNGAGQYLSDIERQPEPDAVETISMPAMPRVETPAAIQPSLSIPFSEHKSQGDVSIQRIARSNGTDPLQRNSLS